MTVGIGFTIIMLLIHNVSPSPYATYIPAFNGLLFWFIILAAIIPTAAASYSVMGEKVENTLEPLLATPLTNDEIILGKILSAFIPCIIATYLGAIIFMIGIDIITFQQFDYILYPNWTSSCLFTYCYTSCLFIWY